MLKGTTFSAQPVFAQLTGMISRSSFAALVKEQGADPLRWRTRAACA